jgi:hypothetical protein
MEDPPPPMDNVLLRLIFQRLSPADLVCAALACTLWCDTVSPVARHAPPPLLGYFFNPVGTPPPPPIPSEPKANYPAIFAPLDAGSPRLSIDAGADFSIHDVHLGLVLLLPISLPRKILPRILALDSASRRRVLLPPPPRIAQRGARRQVARLQTRRRRRVALAHAPQ